MKLIIIIITAFLSLFILPSCTSTAESGQSVQAATKQINTVGGLTTDSVDLNRHMDGFRNRTSTLISVYVHQEASEIDPVEFVDYLLRVAWSVNDKRPNDAIGALLTPSFDNPPLWHELAQTKGIALYPTPDPTVLMLSAEEAAKRYGPWPGPVPSVPLPSTSPEKP